MRKSIGVYLPRNHQKPSFLIISEGMSEGMNFAFIFLDNTIEFDKGNSSGEIPNQPAKRNKSSKKQLFMRILLIYKKL